MHVPKTRPAYVPVAVVTVVNAALALQENAGRLRDAKTRARFQVMASTGLRPSQLKRLTPRALDLTRRTLLVAGAKGGEPIGMYLNDDMLAAWKLFSESDRVGRVRHAQLRTHAPNGWLARRRPARTTCVTPSAKTLARLARICRTLRTGSAIRTVRPHARTTCPS